MTAASLFEPAPTATVRGKPNLVLVRCRGVSTAGLRFRHEVGLALSVIPEVVPTSRLGLTCDRLEVAVRQAGRDTGVPPAFRSGLIDAVPALRRFSACRWRDLNRIDDAVHDAVLRAWASRRGFVLGTALLPWLLGHIRTQSPDPGGSGAAWHHTPDLVDAAGWERLAQATLYEALWTRLDGPQREATALVVDLRLPPRDAARILGHDQAEVVRHLWRAETILGEAWS